MKRYLALALAVAGTVACTGNKDKAPFVQTALVTRRTIVIDAEATGAVEPITVVEVKSKASGLITKMPVETATLVKPGDLLVQIDTRDVQNQYNQADADLKASQAKLQVSEAQKKRSDELFKARVITSQEFENASLDYENAKAAVIRSAANLDLAKQRLEDATVTAPSAGTILTKTVSLGQVITSATNSATGGTTLLTMADLGKVRVRALFNETDIGQVRPGQTAAVAIDAFPDRRFQGVVEKIEPNATVQQNVTMFPVLVTLDNGEGLLKPGMNGEVSVLIDQVNDVIAVPNDALKSVREAAATGQMLGLNVDSVNAEVRAQMQNGFGRSRADANSNGGSTSGRTRVATAQGEVSLAPQGEPFQQPQQGFGQSGRQQIEVTDKQCSDVKAVLAKKPDLQKKLDELRAKARSGELDFAAMRDESEKLYKNAGIDMRVAGACRRKEMQANGGGMGGGQAVGGGGGGGQRGGNRGGQQAQGGGGNLQLSSPETSGFARRTRPGLVFVVDSARKTYHPRIVMLGAANFDYTEVVTGLKDGERVALLASLALQAQRQQQNDRLRQGMGVPGLTPNAGPGGGRPGGGGGGGGPRGGAR
ncbi:MAG TPA: efflux RND transporter periplasmic adaptor subunit [Gemmatimonadaceae bacterium]|nr:efflux RND transporter periplasmic adaptor subunit [Gemmatimonadaceae bacterium]